MKKDGRMKDGLRSILGVIAWVALVIGVPALIGEHWYRADREKEAARVASVQAEERKLEATINSFASSHGAVREWREGLSQFSLTSPIYSYHLEPLFAAYRGKPLLFIARLVNISEQNGEPILFLEGNINIRSHLRLELTADRDTASRISEAKIDSEDGRFAIVAEIDSVGDRPAEESWTESKRPISFAKGRCLDAIYIGDYRGQYDDILRTFKEQSAK